MARIYNLYHAADSMDGLSVVFVHGLGGHPIETWMSNKSEVETFWPMWLGIDAACSIWTIEYDAALSAWRGEAMPLPDQGLAVMEALASEPELRSRPLVLIGHSLGGLVIKAALCEALTFGAEQRRFRDLADQVRGVAFVATPHSGSELAKLARVLRFLLRTNEQVGNMKSHDAHLRSLKRRFDDVCLSYQFRVKTYSESRGVFIGVRIFGLRIGLPVTVVNATSSESHVNGSYAVPLPEDHFSACKPTDRNAELYCSLIDFLREIRGNRQAGSMPSQIDSIRDDTKRTRVGLDRVENKIDELPRAVAKEFERLVATHERLVATQAATLAALAQQLDGRLVADRPQPVVVSPSLADIAPSIVRISQAADEVARTGDRRAAILTAEVARQSQHRDIAEVRAVAEADSQLLQQIAGYKIDVGDFRGAISDLSEALRGTGERDERRRIRRGLGYALAMEIRRIGTYREARLYFDMVVHCAGTPSRLAFNVLVHLSNDAGVARAIMGEMRAANIEPDIYSWNTLLALASDISAARAIMGEMRAAKIEPDIYSWTTLLALASDIPAARAILGEMRAAKIEPNIVSWNTLLALASDISAARAIMGEMRAAKIEPDIYSWTTLLALASDIPAARAIMGEMRSANIEPDIYSWNTLLALASDISAARAIMGEMRAAKIEPDIYSWTTLLALASDIPAARAIMGEMRAAKIEPDIYSWTTLLALASDIPAARAIMGEMRSAKVEPNIVSWNTLLALASDIPAARAIMGEMRSAKVEPNIVSWNTLLALASDISAARVIMGEMRAANIEPDIYSWNTLLALASDIPAARAIMGEMRSAKVEPNIVSWNTLLALASDISAARAIMGEMRSAKIEPNIVSWTTLLALASDIPTARAIMGEMRSAKVEPNIVSWTTLLALASDISAARAILDEMEEARFLPNEVVATTVARLISSLDEAADLTRYLHRFRVVGPGYLQAVVSRITPLLSAEVLLNWVYGITKELGFSPATQVFGPAIAGYRRQGRIEDALRIVLPFPHLPAAQALLKDARTQRQAEAWLLNQFEAGPEPFNASLALAYFYWSRGDREKLEIWADISLSYPNQHPKRIASIQKLLRPPAAA
ncbi:hypothetical protein C7S18_10155 [Ahniella affigens]|uniref:GPI inositol-deacylase PGAP1-like alpha/beta domain-containing protein n=1 Tax=Ahniella affigens TaxID=2021234 RepID=A0A2P1PRT4_9GAMM|nr:hypothetical protein [Ahniella affigens]AVP97535.1 hypothetical protein C7S18_10155 [Ahniella affigens]